MKAKLIVAHNDNTWKEKIVKIPKGIVPDKYSRGSIKWNNAVIKWATYNVDMSDSKVIEFIGVLDSDYEE